jgi:hypothetical protein
MDWSDKPFLPYQLGPDYAGVCGKVLSRSVPMETA